MSSPLNPWTAETADQREREAMAYFSEDLFRAIRREHPQILAYLAKNGKQVAAL